MPEDMKPIALPITGKDAWSWNRMKRNSALSVLRRSSQLRSSASTVAQLLAMRLSRKRVAASSVAVGASKSLGSLNGSHSSQLLGC